MDRFIWATLQFSDSETLLGDRVEAIKLQEGDEKKSKFEDGFIVLTSKRVLWADNSNISFCISLDLSLIQTITEETGTSMFNKSRKLVLQLHSKPDKAASGPVARTEHNSVKICFLKHGANEFYRNLKSAHTKVTYEQMTAKKSATPQASRGVGIAAVENKMKYENKQASQSISVAFKDLEALISKAKEMVTLSQSIASKLEQKKGSITDDETIQFKRYLLSLGIPDPVTRTSHSSSSTYLVELAKEISKVLEPQIKDIGGTMTLTDAYCRFNRARGLELVSPKDLLDASELMSSLSLPIILRTYETGVKVLQLKSENDEAVIQITSRMVEDNTCLSAEELANLLGTSMILAKERLLLAESKGCLCRDDSVEGLKFYRNRFMIDI